MFFIEIVDVSLFASKPYMGLQGVTGGYTGLQRLHFIELN